MFRFLPSFEAEEREGDSPSTHLAGGPFPLIKTAGSTDSSEPALSFVHEVA
jgi:hypothetical protein